LAVNRIGVEQNVANTPSIERRNPQIYTNE
jgi:hypothetical protein